MPGHNETNYFIKNRNKYKNLLAVLNALFDPAFSWVTISEIKKLNIL